MKAKPATPVEKLQALGKNEVKVWTWLQDKETAVLSEAVAIGHQHFVAIEDVATALGMPLGAVATTVISLAQHGFISRITAEGLIAV